MGTCQIPNGCHGKKLTIIASTSNNQTKISSIDQSFLLSLDGFFGILNVNMQNIER